MAIQPNGPRELAKRKLDENSLIGEVKGVFNLTN